MVKDRKRRSKIENVSEPVPESPSVSVDMSTPKAAVNGKTIKNGVKPSPKGDKAEVALNGSKKQEDTLGARNQVKIAGTPKKSNVNTGGSLCVLLTQGIMAKDSGKINTVLSNHNYEVINSTLRELKPMHVFPLLRELELRLKTRGATDIKPWLRWVNSILSVHMSYLTSISTVESEVGSLVIWLKSRIGHQEQLQALHGKISVLADQIKRRTNKVVIPQQPLIIFNNDDDSDPEDNESVGSDDSGETSDDGWWDDEQLKQGGDEDEDDDSDNGIEDSDDNAGGKSDDSSDEEMEEGNENSDDDENEEMDTR